MASSSFMASPSNKSCSRNSSNSPVAPGGGGKFYSPDSTFILTDPSNFRAVVHQFTGLRRETLKPHQLSLRPAGKSTSGDMGPRKPAFKLHERRQSAKKLEITLSRGGIGGEKVMVSPVSPFELLGLASRSPRSSSTPSPTPRSTTSAPSPPTMDKEMRGILENGFYLHPSCSCTVRGSKSPQLLPLFPTHARRDFSDDDHGDE